MNSDEKIQLLEKRWSLRDNDDDDFMGEDPEMIDAKL
jgi:hypothetical protein